MLPTIRRTFDNPFQTLRELDRAVNQMWGDLSSGAPDATGTFPVDIREDGDHLVVDADLPGFQKDQIDVSVEQGVLSIEAERTSTEEQTAGKHHVNERRFTRVARRFTLPNAYDTTEVDASLSDGVLTLRLAKREESKPRKVEVK